MKAITNIILYLLVFSSPVLAGVEVNEFSSASQQQQFKTLVNELRCLVCQNQNLADSNSELAQDLRKEVSSMIVKGNSNDDIIDFMVARYGDFVLYRPPFKPTTFLLWLGPFAILFFATLFVVILILRNKKTDKTVLSDEELDKAEALLELEKKTAVKKGNK